MIKGKTPEEIRKTFNIQNDFTPEEEDQIRRENEWAEEYVLPSQFLRRSEQVLTSLSVVKCGMGWWCHGKGGMDFPWVLFLFHLIVVECSGSLFLSPISRRVLCDVCCSLSCSFLTNVKVWMERGSRMTQWSRKKGVRYIQIGAHRNKFSSLFS